MRENNNFVGAGGSVRSRPFWALGGYSAVFGQHYGTKNGHGGRKGKQTRKKVSQK